jgi:hypothetical protein
MYHFFSLKVINTKKIAAEIHALILTYSLECQMLFFLLQELDVNPMLPT